ncbi:hypothetical protein [Arthrobacter pityocampae]|uniref:hypothetical protein n=1 Tax=Arthrobacter pityocampae TaxID=547334 RepID=UPI003736C403
MIQSLRDQHFEGFIRFEEIPHEEVTTRHGVYAVVRESTAAPHFTVPGTGRAGTHYPASVLEAAWVYDATVLYFGRAQCKAGIFERLNKYRRFGDGKRSGHSGGRAIWQLEDAQHLKVCWRPTNNQDPVSEERALIEMFKKSHHGARPFANRINGTKSRP